jgi:hypothetical protein
MKKKGTISIGGKVEIDVVVTDRDDMLGSDNANRTDDDEQVSTYFGPGTYGAYLDFKIDATPDSFLYIKLDLDDFWNSAADQDDLLEEAYFRFNNVMKAPVDIVFGKKILDYGQDKFTGIVNSFNDGALYTNITDSTADGVNNAHALYGSAAANGFPTGLYDTFQIEGIYHYKELVNLYMTLFQNPTSRGMHEDRSDDTLFFQSYAAKVEVMPMEGLCIEASFINQHNDTAGDGKGDYEADQYALSLGADWQINDLWNVWAEYQHGFDWGYMEDSDLDIFSIGVSYAVNKSLTLSVLGEYADIDEGYSVKTAGVQTKFDDEDYYQVVVNATYTLDSGIFFMLEYAHQWYDGDLETSAGAAANVDFDRDADIIGFRTGWEF